MTEQPATGIVERLAPTGEGVVRDGGRVVFVEGALPGETVTFDLTESHRRWARGLVREILTSSPDRSPTDAHASACGGEDWAHLSLAAARRAKVDLFVETMARLGGFNAPSLRVADISESELGYRLRSQFHLSWVGGRAIAGFYRRRSHDVVPLENCCLISERGRQALQGWLRGLGESDVVRWPTILTAESVATGENHQFAGCDSTQAASLPGLRPVVAIDVAGLRFDVSPACFFQINRFRLEPFFRRITGLVDGQQPGTILEIGAGAGFLTAAVARTDRDVTSVEPSRDAAAAGRLNLERNRPGTRARFVESTTEGYLATNPGHVDLIVVDPPREGLGACAARLAKLARNSFVYVSCEPATLARDLKLIVAESFEISEVFLEDFFPRTHRVEAVVLLQKR